MPETAAELPDPDFSAAQLADLAELLAETVISGNILMLATTLLDEDAADEAKSHFTEDDFAQRVVTALDDAGRLADAIAVLRQGTNPNSKLAYGLNEIMQGRRLNQAALQAFVNKYEPFFNSDEFRRTLPRIMRTVCAIGLGAPVHGLVGTGFLVGPDLVMTNYHVLQQFLKIENDEIVPNGDGHEIFCFFDYHSQPGPRFPIGNGDHPFMKVRAVSSNWLVKASIALAGDGTDQVDVAAAQGKYDYAVIRLEKKVGNLPAGRSGGGARGWLTLTDVLDKTVDRRVIVYQHPGKLPQQFDIGDYKQLDRTNTRLRYTVSTADGSSGGAAVGADGQLFALHVANVVEASPFGQLNQGVAIDLIARDLQGAPGWNPQPPPDEQPMSFWSLTDDLRNPLPIIGRGTFREHVYEMSTKAKPRVMVVSGPAGSGVRYSMKLLQRIVGAQTPVIQFLQQELATKTPREFVRSLLSALGITGLQIPEPNPTENMPRWVRDLTRWLGERLSDDEKKKRVVYPAWIVLNTVVPAGQRFEWAEHLDELIAAIAGARELDQELIDIPQLRLLFLTSSPASLPLTNVERFDEDLANDTQHVEDYLECLQRALHSLDKDDDFGAKKIFEGIARRSLRDNANNPVRQVLSEVVRTMIIDASQP